MCRIGCGFVWLLIIVLSACSSNQSSLDSQINTDSGMKSLETSVAADEKLLESDIELSIDEAAALKELKFSPELYGWIRQTIENTVAFVESTGDSEVVDLVTFYDPAIKHNMSLVTNFKEKLQFANSVQLRINTTYQNLKVTKHPAALEKANLIVWSG